MASGTIKKSSGIITIGAFVLAVAIPSVSLAGGLISENNDRQTLNTRMDKAEALWYAQDEVDAEANAQLSIEKEMTSKHLTVLSAIERSIPGIVCWGDSITAGVGGDQTYPAALQGLLKDDLSVAFRKLFPEGFSTSKLYNLTIPVVNMGVAGESSLTVAGRNGAIPYVITEPFTIPGDTKTEVRISFTSQSGDAVEPLIQGNQGLSSVTIGGVEGKLTVRQAYGEEDRYAYYFTRSKTGKPVTIAAGTTIKSSTEQSYKDYLAVIQLGHNGGWSDANDLIEQINRMIAAQNSPDYYIVLGLAFGEQAELQEVNAALAEAFGNHFIDLWQYMREDGLADAGLEPTLEDTEALEEGLLPISLTDGANAFNSAGYSVIAKCIQRKLYELGYLDEVNTAISQAE